MLATLVAVCKDRDAKADPALSNQHKLEIFVARGHLSAAPLRKNPERAWRRGQVCEALTDTGFRVA